MSLLDDDAPAPPRPDRTPRPLQRALPWAGPAAVAVTVLAWASAFVVIRGVGDSFGAGPLALGRLLVGGLALGSAVLVSRRWVPRPAVNGYWFCSAGWPGSPPTTCC